MKIEIAHILIIQDDLEFDEGSFFRRQRPCFSKKAKIQIPETNIQNSSKWIASCDMLEITILPSICRVQI